MEKNYGKWVLIILIAANVINIEFTTDDLKAAWKYVKVTASDIFNGSGGRTEPTAQSDEEKIRTLFEQAQSLYDSGDFGNLIEVCDAIIQLDPNNDVAYNVRGIAHRKLKQYEQAVKDYNKAIQLNPNLSDAYNNRGALYKELKDYESAVEDLLQAIDLNSNNYAAYANLGEICYELEEHETAILYLNKSIDIGLEGKDLGEALYYRGLSYLKLGNKKQAQSDLNTAKELGYPD